MKQTPDDKGLTPEDENVPEMAEPFWMQDIRLAQRAIDAERARLRAAQTPSSSGSVGPEC